MLDPGVARHPAAPVFAALGDATRLHLVRRLAQEGPTSITRLTEGSGMTRQAITRHLQTLGNAGLVRGRHEGRTHVFAVEFERLAAARRFLDEVSADWDAAGARLKAFVERTP